ncbi:MAG: glycosyltransferase family 4 protein, partial [Deltaproteobacteria bacterium]|nr:glycosyltransferase family 4 protein [Candidatus Tharpella sp.]
HHHGTFGLKLAKKEFGIRIVAYIHNTYCWFGEIEKFNFTKNSIYIDLFIAVSKNVAAYTNRHFQIPFRKIQVVPNGIDVNKHKGNLRRQLKFSRTDLGFAEEDFIMLNVASFHEIKAHKLLFQVMADLKKGYPQIKLLCVGNIFNGGYYQEIKNLLTEMGLQETVLLQDFSEDIWNYYRIADCFILPSFYEGWSLAMTEAMYYSLPLILSDVGASRDVIENEDIGLVVANPFGSILDLEQEKLYKLVAQDNFQNADNFTVAILRMYKERQHWQAAGKLGHAKVAADYNFENVMSALQKVL